MENVKKQYSKQNLTELSKELFEKMQKVDDYAVHAVKKNLKIPR